MARHPAQGRKDAAEWGASYPQIGLPHAIVGKKLLA